MPLSVWEYLRARTRDAVLAGIQDALDVAEQGDTNGSQSDAANKLVTKLSASEAVRLPEPSLNGNGKHHETAVRNGTLEAPRRPTEPAAGDDELERRIDAAAPQRAQERPADGPPPSVPPGRITNRKRGRPPKNRQDGNG
jgi:hypothetical protein